MNIQLFDTFLKTLGLNICISYIFFKIINYSKISNFKKILITSVSIITSIVYILLKDYLNNILSSIIIYLLFSFFLSTITENKYGYSFLITIISISISYITFIITTTIYYIIIALLNITNYTNPINFIVISIIDFILIFLLFKLRRFKHGFQFIKKNNNNDNLDIFVFITSIIIIFIYFLFGNYTNLSLRYIFVGFLIFSLFMIPIIQKAFILFHKQTLTKKAMKDYEIELMNLRKQLQTALQEKHALVKSNHEFYHRQEALKQKLNTLIQTSTHSYSTETADEIAQIQDRINTLSEEYTKNTKTKISLPKTHIPELDDMFSYMQSECEKNNIEFILKLNNDINYMLENIIPKNKLETLIGDLLRNAIIAINHSKNEYKSIMAILGIKDNFFEFCVHDSGVDFEISTLLKLGTEPTTTHKYSGGTGIGFITTFETLDYCNASIIINENPKSTNNYTKSIIIRFDNNHDYIINSYRADEISNSNNINRNIIVNDIKI